MPIQLDDSEKLNGLKIDRTLVQDMHQTYIIDTDAPKLKFAHFTLNEVITLLISNNIITKQKFTKKELIELGGYGLKIVLGNHFNAATCPPNRINPHTEPNYLHKNTVILTNTKLDKKVIKGQDTKTKDTWKYLLKDHKSNENDLPVNFISIAGLGLENQDDEWGLDRGTICQPDCPDSIYADANGQYHEIL